MPCEYHLIGIGVTSTGRVLKRMRKSEERTPGSHAFVAGIGVARAARLFTLRSISVDSASNAEISVQVAPRSV